MAKTKYDRIYTKKHPNKDRTIEIIGEDKAYIIVCRKKFVKLLNLWQQGNYDYKKHCSLFYLQEGSAFNNGWSLLYENKHDDIVKTLNTTNFIFISHEHPDHFSIKFFKEYKDIILRNNIKILFQETDDMRVEKFLKSLGLNLILLKHKKEHRFDQYNSITLIKQGHIDSAFLYETKNNYHININDCNFIDRELKEIKTLIKDKSKKLILYIQFSYASFRPTEEWLKKAANYKLKNIKSYLVLDLLMLGGQDSFLVPQEHQKVFSS